MPKNRQVTEALTCYLMLFWAASVFAAGNSFEEGIRSISPFMASMICILSGAGGLAGTLNRTFNAENPSTNKFSTILTDMVCSLVFGWLAYFATTALPFSFQSILIIMAGVGGAKALDGFVKKSLMPALSALMSRVFGAATPKE
jgi:hypothetical protein